MKNCRKKYKAPKNKPLCLFLTHSINNRYYMNVCIQIIQTN